MEIFWFKTPAGQTTWSAWILFGVSALFFFVHEKKNAASAFQELKDAFKKAPLFIRVSLGAIACGALGIGLISMCASFLPPHTLPEADVLNYHYTLVRQHLITHRFTHLAWSSADLWLMPLQFGLAPFWFSTGLPNKLPQFFFMMGLWAVCYRLAKRHGGPAPILTAISVVAAMAGSHAFGVQYGTAMLDIIICYLFVAAIDSFLDGRFFISAIEFSFFFWSKPFMPLQVLLIAAVVLVLMRPAWLWSDGGKKFFFYFLGASIFIAGPFLVKSFHYSGTPLYPFGAAHASPALQTAATAHLGARNAYGNGRSLTAFLTHFWRVAVPSRGVNNEFDYPLGLPFLIFLIPFLIRFGREVRARQILLSTALVVVWWVAWWMGSQQSRWLYIPLVFLFMTSLADEKVLYSRGIWMSLVLSVGLTFLSVLRGNWPDMGKSRWDVVRPQDQRLATLGETVKERPVPVEDKDAAYAPYEVVVTSPERMWVLPPR
jgi:hypothetical protein